MKILLVSKVVLDSSSSSGDQSDYFLETLAGLCLSQDLEEVLGSH